MSEISSKNLQQAIKELLQASARLDILEWDQRAQFIALGVKDFIAYRLLEGRGLNEPPANPEPPKILDTVESLISKSDPESCASIPNSPRSEDN